MAHSENPTDPGSVHRAAKYAEEAARFKVIETPTTSFRNEAKRALQAIAGAVNSARCENLGHSVRYRHDYLTPCPVVQELRDSYDILFEFVHERKP